VTAVPSSGVPLGVVKNGRSVPGYAWINLWPDRERSPAQRRKFKLAILAYRAGRAGLVSGRRSLGIGLAILACLR
jgi:hypothetical protein